MIHRLEDSKRGSAQPCELVCQYALCLLGTVKTTSLTVASGCPTSSLLRGDPRANRRARCGLDIDAFNEFNQSSHGRSAHGARASARRGRAGLFGWCLVSQISGSVNMLLELRPVKVPEERALNVDVFVFTIVFS